MLLGDLNIEAFLSHELLTDLENADARNDNQTH